LNPLFSFSGYETNIAEILYLGLVTHKWNDAKGELETFPMLAKSWQWNEDSSSIILWLRDDVNWTDGKKFTADDVVFSFDVYSDPDIQSRLYGSFDKFYLEENLHINLAKTFEVINPFKIKINFKKNSIPALIDIDYPLIPKHIFVNVDRKNFISIEKDLNKVTDGPFNLAKWDKNQAIILEANKESFLYNPENADEIIFKIVPDYNSRITQLKKGEIDLIEEVRPDAVPNLKKNDQIEIASIEGRDYDYIGWNNIDPDVYKKRKNIVPNKIFGTDAIRKALSYAINKEEILNEYLNNYGKIAAGPVSPIFKSAYNNQLQPYNYDFEKAKEILNSEGWNDKNNDGILDKEGKELSFTLYIPSGNPRREYASTIIKNNLKSVGIEVKVESLEPGVFFEKVFNREFNAWMAGWFVPIPLTLKPYWHSDLSMNQLNLVAYQNKEVSSLLEKFERERYGMVKDSLSKKFQEIIYNDCPVTFLYWIDNIIAYNKKIKNLTTSPLGPMHQPWNWRIVKE